MLTGALTTVLALAAVVCRDRAAPLLPRGRIVLLAVLFSLLGVLEPDLHREYGDVEAAIGCLAAVLGSPGSVGMFVTVLVAGMLADPLAGGHSLAWILTGPGQGTSSTNWSRCARLPR